MKNIIILFIFLNIILSCSRENETINPIVEDINPIIGEWKLTNVKNSDGQEIVTPCEIEYSKFILKNDNVSILKTGLFYQNGGCTEFIDQPDKWKIINDSLILTDYQNSKAVFRFLLSNNILKTKLIGFISPNGTSQFSNDESLISEYWHSKN